MLLGGNTELVEGYHSTYHEHHALKFGESVYKLLSIVVLSAAAVYPDRAVAQEAVPAQAEIVQLQTRLGALQAQALQDSVVSNARTAFEDYLITVMDRLDASANGKLTRADALVAEVAAARAANDNAKLNALATEAAALEEFLGKLQERAFADAGVQQQREAFVAVLLARMNLIDPQAKELIDRLEKLRAGSPQR